MLQTAEDAVSPAAPPQHTQEASDEEDLDEEEAADAIQACRERAETGSQAKRQRKSKLTVGNLWEPLPVAEKPNKWTVFVRGEDPSVEDASGLGVEKVVFNLPSDFSPSTVTVSNIPFSITQHGSSSVDVKVMIHMADGSKQEVEHSLNFERPMTSTLLSSSTQADDSEEDIPLGKALGLVNSLNNDSQQPSRWTKYLCDYCGRTLTNAAAKTNHQKACPSKPETNEVTAKVEQNTHISGPPVPCRAKVEQKTHISGLPFSCDYCGRGLKNAGSKVNHEKACANNGEITKAKPAPTGKGEPDWQISGHRWLGKRVLRVFGEQQVGGIVTGWMPPNPQDVSEPVLFHVKHDDGDEEDLDEEEAAAAIQACRDNNAGTPNSLKMPNPSNSLVIYSCDYCGRTLTNAGSKTNHQKACPMKPGYDPPPSQQLVAVSRSPVEQKTHSSGLPFSCDYQSWTGKRRIESESRESMSS